MKAYKGFDKDMKCLGFQFEEGKTYEEDTADLGHSGFHACEAPLDVFRHYEPGNGSIYREVELEEVSEQRESEDSKMCGKRITIGAELGIPELVNAHMEWVKNHTTTEHTDPRIATAGEYGTATAGKFGAATAGKFGAATAGDRGAATAGYLGAATAGYLGAATAGYLGAATAGDRGAATAGEYGTATAGDSGAATSRGKSSAGENGLAVARGNDVLVRGGMGAVLVICEENKDSSNIKEWRAVVVDGKIIKADTWYVLQDGELVEVEE